MSGEDVYIIGVAMHPFGRFPEKDSMDMASEICMAALDDAQMTMGDVQVFGCGTQYETGSGQRVLDQIGETGIPVYNVVNACATGAMAVRTAYMEVKAGSGMWPGARLREDGQERHDGRRPGGTGSPGQRWPEAGVPAERSTGADHAHRGDPGHRNDARHVRRDRPRICPQQRGRRVRAVRQGGRQEP